MKPTAAPLPGAAFNIRAAATVLFEAVAAFAERARTFCYAVMLSGHPCPECGGDLVMLKEGLCRCEACAHTFDPTITFQRCDSCGGSLRLVVRRYQCQSCKVGVRSRFLFDGQ